MKHGQNEQRLIPANRIDKQAVSVSLTLCTRKKMKKSPQSINMNYDMLGTEPLLRGCEKGAASGNMSI